MIVNSILAGDGQPVKGIIRFFDDDLQAAITDTYIKAGVTLGQEIVIQKREVSYDLEKAIADEIEILRELTDLQSSTVDQIEKVIAKGISEGKTTAELTEILLDSGIFSPMRALRIARTITGAGSSRGQLLSGILAGADTKSWLSAGDSHVRDSHQRMNGETRPINELYSNGARYPIDPRLPVGERVNCRCSQMFSITEEVPFTTASNNDMEVK